MPFKVQVGPPQIAIHQGQTALVSEPDGRINWPSEITTQWSGARQRVRSAYSNRDFRRAVTASVLRAPLKAVSANGRLSFDVALQPSEAWHACLLYTLEHGEQHFHAPHDCIGQSYKSHPADGTARPRTATQTIASGFAPSRADADYRYVARELVDRSVILATRMVGFNGARLKYWT
jgi:hypothetical protein